MSLPAAIDIGPVVPKRRNLLGRYHTTLLKRRPSALGNNGLWIGVLEAQPADQSIKYREMGYILRLFVDLVIRSLKAPRAWTVL